MSVSIVIVDDEPDVAELFRQRFRREARQGTYVMHFAASGEEALALLGGEIEPGVIAMLSDINMPGMDGLELLSAVKQRFPDLPVMMVTGHGDDDRRARQRIRRRPVPQQAGRFCLSESAAAAIVGSLGLSGMTMTGPAKIHSVDDEADIERLIRQRFRHQIRAG